MLRKIVSIKNVGTFKNHGVIGDIEHRQLNLIHADNARGKTTLCAILRSLKTGDANRILERKTIDSPDAPAVKLLLDSGTVDFRNGAWSASFEHLEIFDWDFVTENVYSGDLVSHNHKRNLCRVVIGADGVKLAKIIDDLDDAERTAGSELAAAKLKAEKLLPKDMTLEAFMELAKDEDVDSKIEAKQEDVELMNSADALRQRQGLTIIALPELPNNIESMLAKTIDGVSAEAAQAVREHIEEKLNTKGTKVRAEEWLSSGLQIVRTDDCPLCGQPFSMSDIIVSMQSYFSQAYRDFQIEVSTFVDSIRSVLRPSMLDVVRNTIEINAESINFWNIYTEVGSEDISFEDEILPYFDQARIKLEPLLTAKLAQPLEPVRLGADVLAALDELEEVRARVEKYNDFVRSANQTIKEVKERAAKDNFDSVRKEIALLEAQRLRHETETTKTLLVYTTAQAKKTKIEIDKEQARENLNAYNAGVMTGYEEEVNGLLVRMGATFRLRVDKKVNYTGGTPRVSYALEIRGKVVDLGNEKTPAGKPCFKNTLSMGDRSTLALAFFIAQLRKRADIKDLVVVFDDPFTSLDGFRQNWTCMEIRRIASAAKQVILLSHSKAFLLKIVERCKVATKVLQIATQAGPDSHIVEFDLDDETIEQFEREIVQLRAFVEGECDDALKTIRCIRPALECHLRRMAPSVCPKDQTSWLGKMVPDIVAADDVSLLAPFKKFSSDLENLVEYTNPFHHDSDSAPDINSEELKANARVALMIMERPAGS